MKRKKYVEVFERVIGAGVNPKVEQKGRVLRIWYPVTSWVKIDRRDTAMVEGLLLERQLPYVDFYWFVEKYHYNMLRFGLAIILPRGVEVE